jgi:hypothetical protein
MCTSELETPTGAFPRNAQRHNGETTPRAHFLSFLSRNINALPQCQIRRLQGLVLEARLEQPRSTRYVCQQKNGNELEDRILYATSIGHVHLYELQTEYSSMVSANKERWAVLGFRDYDEEQVREEQDRAEQEVFDETHYSFVTCNMRFGEDVTWRIA